MGCDSQLKDIMTTELDASMANLRQLHGQSARTQQQLQGLQEEQCRLNLEFEHRLVQHAQAHCKQLASMMHTKLPVELRELIYQYLYLEDAPIPVGSYHFTTYVPEPLRSDSTNPPTHSEPFIIIPEGAIRQDHSVERDENIVYPDSRLLDPAYLGHHITREASVYYYKSNTFSVCTLENALPKFLFRDPIYNFTGQQRTPDYTEPLGLFPIDHIRNLQIRIKYEHFNAYLTFYDNLHDGEKNLLRGIFDVLLDFGNRISPTIASQMRVEFCIMTAYKLEQIGQDSSNEENGGRHHLNLLEAIRVPVYMLKHEVGADIAIIHYDEHVSIFPRDVTNIFQLSKDQWSQEKQAYKAAGISYSPLQYYVERKSAKNRLGFFLDDPHYVLQYRWGLYSAFDLQCGLPIKENQMWPIPHRLLF